MTPPKISLSSSTDIFHVDRVVDRLRDPATTTNPPAVEASDIAFFGTVDIDSGPNFRTPQLRLRNPPALMITPAQLTNYGR